MVVSSLTQPTSEFISHRFFLLGLFTAFVEDCWYRYWALLVQKSYSVNTSRALRLLLESPKGQTDANIHRKAQSEIKYIMDRARWISVEKLVAILLARRQCGLKGAFASRHLAKAEFCELQINLSSWEIRWSGTKEKRIIHFPQCLFISKSIFSIKNN